MTQKRTKMLTLWVTPEEHERLLARCDSPRLAVWIRQVCLDEKTARASKPSPTLAPELLRQLAGMGNNLNQIARRLNSGQWSAHDRVQVVSALMVLERELQLLREQAR
ncbi:MobC family plasmid mobilization relaxosome protein [Yersinia ruckeri]|nr:MobC family plasmid mobilization relaxosome protein [Yersinia ruckeri]